MCDVIDNRLMHNTPNPPNQTHQLLATATFGMEAVVSRELTALGYDPHIVDTGRVAFTGDDRAIADANLWLRSADRVLLQVGRFRANDFGALFDQTYALPWHRYIPRDAYFPVNGRSVKSQLSSVPACQKIVKKAIAEKLLAAHRCDHLPDQRDQGPQCVIEVSLLKDEATLTIDTSGAGLHKRGYRAKVGNAPLKETLAAGLIMLSYWRHDRPFMDPFCGSGTLAIEAAMIGRRIAPGLRRDFAAQTWPWLEESIWINARHEAVQAAEPDLPVRLIATDIDEDALDLARYHAKLAGVDGDIHFQKRDFHDLAAKQPYGCLITNPPYGQRLGESQEIESLYRVMPIVLAKLKTWSHYILTAYPDFESLIGQKANRRRKLYNAQIECTYYQFHGPRPPKHHEYQPIDEHSEQNDQDNHKENNENQPDQNQKVASNQLNETTTDVTPATSASATPSKPEPVRPAFGGLPDRAEEQAQLFHSRLTKLARHLRKWPTQKSITCMRLYERDIPEVPLVVDRYENCLHMAEYERPNEHTEAQHYAWLELMQKTAADALGIDPKLVFFKHRRRQRGDTQHERFSEENRTFVVQEAGLKFKINLSDYVDTGLFLDHRQTRTMVRERAQGKRFLNLFAYTGSFSVYAAAGGAAETTTVDLSNTYLDWAKDNFALNGIDFKSGNHRLQRSDVMAFVADHPRVAGGQYDLAVVDPPTFSNSKTTENVWDIQRDHVALLNHVIELMSPGGLIYFSTNFRRFKLDEPALQNVKTIREISQQTVPEDFRNKRIHRCWYLVVK